MVRFGTYCWSGSIRDVATAEPATLRSSMVGVCHTFLCVALPLIDSTASPPFEYCRRPPYLQSIIPGRDLPFAHFTSFGCPCPPALFRLASLVVHPCTCLSRVPRFWSSHGKVHAATLIDQSEQTLSLESYGQCLTFTGYVRARCDTQY